MLASLAPGCSRLGLGPSDQQSAVEVRGKISADANIPGPASSSVKQPVVALPLVPLPAPHLPVMEAENLGRLPLGDALGHGS